MIAFRPFRTADLDSIVALMRETHASFAGLSSTRSLRALCMEAMTHVSLVVAEEHDAILGYVAAVVDHERYWRGLGVRRPMLAAEILYRRILRFMRRRRREPRPSISPPSTSSAFATYWNESAPSIGKILHVGVRASARGKGIGTGLYRRLFELMRRGGVRRIDARIDAANAASVKLHRTCGFELELLGDGWIATAIL